VMQEEKRISILGLLIVLIAIVLVAVGVMGLLTQDGRVSVSVPGAAGALETSTAGSAAATEVVAPEAPQALPAQATVTVESAVVRGGSRNRPAEVSQPAPGEVMLPGETSPIARAGDLVNVPGTSAFRVEVLGALYDVSGRPAQGCAAFDNKVPVRRLTLQLAVVNDSGMNFQPGEWGAAAYINNARAVLCFSGDSGLPVFTNGTRQSVIFIVFANPDQAITSVTISTLNGLSARACFEEERVVACPAT
jgi:archaellum component FlaG (FlaF/FlaG flagellin family)